MTTTQPPSEMTDAELTAEVVRQAIGEISKTINPALALVLHEAHTLLADLHFQGHGPRNLSPVHRALYEAWLTVEQTSKENQDAQDNQ